MFPFKTKRIIEAEAWFISSKIRAFANLSILLSKVSSCNNKIIIFKVRITMLKVSDDANFSVPNNLSLCLNFEATKI